MQVFANIRRTQAINKLKETKEMTEARAVCDALKPPIVSEAWIFQAVSPIERKAIMDCPQHLSNGAANPVWLYHKFGAMSGSIVNNIAGHGFTSFKKFVTGYVWPKTRSFNQTFCEYGNVNEDNAEKKFFLYMDKRCADPLDPLQEYTVFHCGLVKETYATGHSPDGYVKETYHDGSTSVMMLEYKCPYSKRNLRRPDGCNAGWRVYRPGDSALYGPLVAPPLCTNFMNPSKRRSKKEERDLTNKLVLPITPYYYDQVQWGMGVMKRCGILHENVVYEPVLKCYFVVWTPHFTQISSIPFDSAYCEHLVRTNIMFYKDYYIPNMLLKQKNQLAFGEVNLFSRKLSTPPTHPPPL